MQTTLRRYICYCLSNLLISLIVVSINAQTSNLITKRKTLAISDFKGAVDERANNLARTYIVISIKYFKPLTCDDVGKVMLKVETDISISEKSWMKLDRIESKEMLQALLSHEQGHYDIGEIFAIDLKKTLSSNCFDKHKHKSQADSVFQSLNKYYDSLQLKYDLDTGHMRNRERQSKWKQDIAAMYERINSKK